MPPPPEENQPPENRVFISRSARDAELTGSLAQFLRGAYYRTGYIVSNERLDVSHPPGKIDYRVFIGGNYALMPILRFVGDIVVREGLQPIIAADFDIPRDKTNEYSQRLLLQCRRAIFECTIGNGHSLEIQKVLDSGAMGISMLLLYMTQIPGREFPNTVTSMIRSLANPRPQGYISLGEMDNLILGFLRTPVK